MSKPLDHPPLQRITHLINLINIAALTISGFFIHFPIDGVPMNLIRNIHFIFMYLLIFNGIVRIYYAFFGKYKDWRNFVLSREDWRNLIPQIKYYLFLGKKPKTGKYNPLQKLAYLALPLLALVQIVTGAILYWPETFASLANAFGGLGAVRGMHYVAMWLIIAIVVVHVYMVFTEAREQLWQMFLGRTREKKQA